MEAIRKTDTISGKEHLISFMVSRMPQSIRPRSEASTIHRSNTSGQAEVGRRQEGERADEPSRTVHQKRVKSVQSARLTVRLYGQPLTLHPVPPPVPPLTLSPGAGRGPGWG